MKSDDSLQQFLEASKAVELWPQKIKWIIVLATNDQIQFQTSLQEFTDLLIHIRDESEKDSPIIKEWIPQLTELQDAPFINNRGILQAPTAHELALKLESQLHNSTCLIQTEENNTIHPNWDLNLIFDFYSSIAPGINIVASVKNGILQFDADMMESRISWERSRALASGRSHPQKKAVKAAHTKRTSLDSRALALFIEDPDLTKKQIAQKLECHEKSLAPSRCPKLDAAIKAYKAKIDPSSRLVQGEIESGNIEAWET